MSSQEDLAASALETEHGGGDGDGKVLPKLQTYSHSASVYLMISAILWCGPHWGFISFSAPTLEESEGLSYTKIGSFIPVFGVVYIICTFVVGIIADRVSHKLLLVSGLVLLAGGHVLFLSGVYPVMLAGMVAIGIGYSPWTLLPYVQIKLLTGRDRQRHDRFYMAVELFFILSFSLGRLLMMMCVSFISNGDDFPGTSQQANWRLPWIISACLLVLHGLLLLLFATFPMPPARLVKGASVGADGREAEVTYKEKLRALYMNPVAALILAGSVGNALTTYGVAAWAPTIAQHFFPWRSEESVNATVVLAVLIAWPLGLIVIVLAMKQARNIKNALWISAAFVVVAAFCLMGFSLATKGSFLVFIAFFVLFAAAGNWPSVFFKQLPDVLGVKSPALKMFYISRFTLVYSIFGDIVGWQVTGLLIDEQGFSFAVWFLVVAGFVAAFFWIIPSVWALRDSGPIHERSLEQLASDEATLNWGKLKTITYRKIAMKETLLNTLFHGQGTGVLGFIMNLEDADRGDGSDNDNDDDQQ